jgi:hypothetical protein
MCRVLPCSVGQVFPYPVESAAALEWKLEQVAALPDSGGPILAILHLLAPHEPYVFAGNCRHQTPFWPMSDVGRDSAEIVRSYAAQVQCVNRLVLRTVTDIIARSRVPPVILLQSDHGHGRIAIDPMRGILLPLEALSATQVAERTDVFAAYRFTGAAGAVWPSMSPVNVLPTVFNLVLGTSLPRHADRTYWSSFARPLDLTEIP